MGFDPHLDANLLAAWLEGGLTSRQRARVLRHIGECDDCRSWTACAQSAHAGLPAREALLPPQITLAGAPAPGGYRRWLAPLSLAASAALVAAAVWRVRPAVVPKSPAAAPIHVLAAGTLPPAQVPQPRLQAASATPAPRPRSFGVSRVAAVKALPPLVAAPAPAIQAPLQPRLDFAPLLTGFQDQPELPIANSSLASWDGAVNSGSGSATASDAVAITPAGTQSAGTGAAWPFASGFASRGGVSDGPLAPSIASGLGWAISRGGEVLRSIGAGVWQAVPLVPGVHFRALAEIGDHIWAGGRADQLYYSPDHGTHWRAVRLPKLGAHPAPLQSIAFYDVHHGTVMSQDGRVWVTSDGGSTWTAE
jgi:hypothetical protein